MNPDPRHHERLMTGLVAFLAMGFFIAIGFWPSSKPEPERSELPTAGFRRHHDELKGILQDWTGMIDALPAATPRRQLEIMSFSVGFLKQHLLTHEASEERILYPAVDRLLGPGPKPFTTPLREEHRIIERWVHDLEERAQAVRPDAWAFSHRAYELAGLLQAHFEVEEKILLPVFDRRMTPDQFRRDVWLRMLTEMD